MTTNSARETFFQKFGSLTIEEFGLLGTLSKILTDRQHLLERQLSRRERFPTNNYGSSRAARAVRIRDRREWLRLQSEEEQLFARAGDIARDLMTALDEFKRAKAAENAATPSGEPAATTGPALASGPGGHEPQTHAERQSERKGDTMT